MIIDSHVHIYPDNIAHKASEGIGKFYGIPMKYDGTVSTLLANGEAAGIDKFLVHSVATTAAQVKHINDFLYSQLTAHSDRFIGFAAMHPDFEDIDAEIERVISLGFKGIKLHPDFQKFEADGEKAFRLYGAISGKLPILIHAGDNRYKLSSPNRIMNILETFPDMTVIAAHFGGWSEWNEVAGNLHGSNLYVDTSSSFYALNDKKVLELIKYFGEDKVIFGTDYPMWSAKGELERLDALDLDADVKEKIKGENARALLLP